MVVVGVEAAMRLSCEVDIVLMYLLVCATSMTLPEARAPNARTPTPKEPNGNDRRNSNSLVPWNCLTVVFVSVTR